MTARHFMRGTSGTKEEFLTHGTVGFIFSTFAIVICVESSVNAHATIMTVLKILGTANTTKTTIGAMVGPFVICHPEIANAAVIFSKLNSTLDAIVTVYFPEIKI